MTCGSRASGDVNQLTLCSFFTRFLYLLPRGLNLTSKLLALGQRFLDSPCYSCLELQTLVLKSLLSLVQPLCTDGNVLNQGISLALELLSESLELLEQYTALL